jgi:hypothetical protein
MSKITCSFAVFVSDLDQENMGDISARCHRDVPQALVGEIGEI